MITNINFEKDLPRSLPISTTSKTYQDGYQFQLQVKLTGIVINSRHTGHRNCESRAKVATILAQDNFCSYAFNSCNNNKLDE